MGLMLVCESMGLMLWSVDQKTAERLLRPMTIAKGNRRFHNRISVS